MISNALRDLLKPLQNGEIAASQARYLRGQFPFLGVKKPLLVKAIQQLKTLYPQGDRLDAPRTQQNKTRPNQRVH